VLFLFLQILQNHPMLFSTPFSTVYGIYEYTKFPDWFTSLLRPSTLINCIQVLQFTSLLLAAFYFLLKRIQALQFTSLLQIFTALQSSSLHFLTALLHLDIELAAVVSCSKLGDSGLVLEMKIYCRIRNSYYSCMVIVTYLNC
jgi:hypothetical protein